MVEEEVYRKVIDILIELAVMTYTRSMLLHIASLDRSCSTQHPSK